MSGKVFVDTNVIVYAHDDAAPAKRDSARRLLAKGITDGGVATSTQVLSEFFVTITRKVQKPLSAEAARHEIRLLAALDLADIDLALVDRAIEAHGRWQVSYWDGLIIAAAERLGCDTLLSEDLSDGQVYGSVTVRNPFSN
jgi:predicted nucleic acid-binding protein